MSPGRRSARPGLFLADLASRSGQARIIFDRPDVQVISGPPPKRPLSGPARSGPQAQTGPGGCFFVPHAPGSLAIMNETTSFANKWPVSQQKPPEHSRFAGGAPSTEQSFFNMLPRTADAGRPHAVLAIPGGTGYPSSAVLMSFLDSSVAIFDWLTRQASWRSQAAHTGNIFDCHFPPQNPDTPATSSYDGTVTHCDVPSMTITRILRSNENLSYRMQHKSAAVFNADSDLGIFFYQ